MFFYKFFSYKVSEKKTDDLPRNSAQHYILETYF